MISVITVVGTQLHTSHNKGISYSYQTYFTGEIVMFYKSLGIAKMSDGTYFTALCVITDYMLKHPFLPLYLQPQDIYSTLSW